MRHRRAVGRALTLLELLLVVFLLAAVAASAVSLADNADLQARYELTKSRREQIREAILGPKLTANGQPIVRGFVADMGRLPTSLRELLVPVDKDGVTLSLQMVDGTSRGWRGPYLTPDVEDGTPVFRDGWGNQPHANDPTALNFGWGFVATADTVDVVSRGRDGAPDNSGGSLDTYAGDWPYPEDAPIASLVLIRPEHWQVDVAGWQLTALIHDDGDGSITIPTALRARILVPNATANDWLWQPPGATTPDYLSEPVLDHGLNAQGLREVSFTFDPSVSRWIPAGTRTIEIVDPAVDMDGDGDGDRITPSAVLRVVLLPGTTPAPIEMRWWENQ